MSSKIPDELLLLIRCPSCGQRFKVGEDLRERTVECGGCEHRFKISDEVIVRGRKFYPSEHKSVGMNRFNRIPLPSGGALMGMQPIRYSSQPDPLLLEPLSPQRVIAGIIGVAGMVLMALLLMLGGSRGGALDGMTVTNRVLLAGFVCVMGVVMLIYANPRGRLKAFGVGLILSVGLLAVPFVFTAGSVPLEKRVAIQPRDIIPPIVDGEVEPAEAPEIVALRSQIGTGPLVAEIARLAKGATGKQAVGLWLRGLSESSRFLVKDYILRVTHAEQSSHFYPRDGGDFLLVVTGVSQSLQEIAALAAPLGRVEKTYPEVAVIEVRVGNDIFTEGSIEKLSDKLDPEFYELNKRELESIDLERVKRAVQRLAEADPKVYRSDINRKLIALLGEDGVDFHGAVCRALEVWSEQPGPAGEAALKVAKKRVAKNEAVPPEVVSLIVKEKNTAIIPILDELWFKNPMTWESIYSDLGAPAEATVIGRFPETKGTIRYSAVRILGRVGGVGSLPVLAEAGLGADAELKVLLSQAERSIRTRLGE